jgi:hypothetical protein
VNFHETGHTVQTVFIVRYSATNSGLQNNNRFRFQGSVVEASRIYESMCNVPDKIMKMQMFATSEKVKPDTENIRGLSLVAVKRKNVQVTRQPL